MHKGNALSAAVEQIHDGSSLMIGGFMGIGSPHRLIGELVRQDRKGLTVIGCMSVNRRSNGRGGHARVPQEALRHALGYVDEHSYTSASDELVDGRPSG